MESFATSVDAEELQRPGIASVRTRCLASPKGLQKFRRAISGRSGLGIFLVQTCGRPERV